MNLNRRQPSERRDGCPFVSIVSYGGTVLLALVVWLLLTGTVLAASAADPETPKRGGTLRLAAISDIRSLDPPTVWDWLEGILTMMLYRPLLDYDENERLVPMLAEALPAISADGRTYTFRLKSGVLFSNGRELVAEDVVYSLERHLDPKNAASFANYYLNIAGAANFRQARSNELASGTLNGHRANLRWMQPTNVAGLRALDRYTLRIQLDQPDFIFSDILATPYSVVVPREEVVKPGVSFALHPVGCGPFVLKEWKHGVRLRLERNPHYFIAGRPFLEAVEVSIGPDDATQIMMFERGELDWFQGVPDSDFLRLKRHPHYRSAVESVGGNNPRYIALNCEFPPFTDKRIRQAFNYAVNKDHLLKVLLHRGVLARGVLPNSIKGFNPDLPGYPYNPARAKTLLAAAGYTNSHPIRLLTIANPRWQKIALVVIEDLKAVGVEVALQELNVAAYLDECQRRKRVPMAVCDWVPNFNDPKDTLDLLVNGDRIAEVGCGNAAFYSNPQVNELFRQAAPEMDAARRLRLYQEIERIVAADAPWIFLFNNDADTLRQPWLKGFKMRPVWPQRLENVWLER